ncbi:MAG: hypothetical protein K6F94_01095 [Bacteroidaceae bacterium]|nr:hypothetical protein [Bacteroidaceae bacterium]
MKHYLPIVKYTVLGALLLTSCHETLDRQELQAGGMLSEARVLLANSQFEAARDTIISLRQRHPHAIAVRRAAILTLDSIELIETRDTLARLDMQLEHERQALGGLAPMVNGVTNESFYTQRRHVQQLENHYDELCAKVKFYVRKIEIDAQNQ